MNNLKNEEEVEEMQLESSKSILDKKIEDCSNLEIIIMQLNKIKPELDSIVKEGKLIEFQDHRFFEIFARYYLLF